MTVWTAPRPGGLCPQPYCTRTPHGDAEHDFGHDAPAVDGCPDCGRNFDQLGGNRECPTCAAEPTRADVFAEGLTDAIDRWLEASAELAEQIRAAERLAAGTPLADAAHRFASFHLAELEGKDHGWLGVFVVDALRELREGKL